MRASVAAFALCIIGCDATGSGGDGGGNDDDDGVASVDGALVGGDGATDYPAECELVFTSTSESGAKTEYWYAAAPVASRPKTAWVTRCDFIGDADVFVCPDGATCDDDAPELNGGCDVSAYVSYVDGAAWTACGTVHVSAGGSRTERRWDDVIIRMTF